MPFHNFREVADFGTGGITNIVKLIVETESMWKSHGVGRLDSLNVDLLMNNRKALVVQSFLFAAVKGKMLVERVIVLLHRQRRIFKKSNCWRLWQINRVVH